MAKSDNIQTRFLLPEEYDQWDGFVDRSIDGTIFHKSHWLATFAGWQQLEFRIAGCFKGKELAGGMAFTSKRKYGFLNVMQIPLKTPFFGPVISRTETQYLSKAESHRQMIIDALLGFIMSETGMITAVLTPSFTDIRPFIWKGCESGIHYTYITRISKEVDLLSLYDASVRRQVRKGEQQEFTFSTDNSKEFILHARTLEQRSFQRQKLNLDYASEEQFFTFIDELVKESSAQTYTMVHEDKAIASQIVLLDQSRKMAYYWLAGADQSYLSTGLNQLLLHLVLTDLCEKGFEGFDFVGAGTETIAKYKATFNFPLVSFYSVNKYSGLAGLGMKMKKLM